MRTAEVGPIESNHTRVTRYVTTDANPDGCGVRLGRRVRLYVYCQTCIKKNKECSYIDLDLATIKLSMICS